MSCVSLVAGVVRQGKSEKGRRLLRTQSTARDLLLSNIDLHGGCLSCSIVTKKGCDLAFIESNIHPIYCWLRLVCKNLHQILNAYSWNQSCWFRFTEGISLKKIYIKKSRMRKEYNDVLILALMMTHQ